jgi:hypothetical protein
MSFIMLMVFTLNVIMLNVIMLSVVVPLKGRKKSFGKRSSGDRNNDKIRMKWGKRKIWGHHI